MSIREKLQHLPTEPGVYLMKDKKNQIIYVGKAKSVKNRVSQYFQKSEQHPRTRALVSEIADFDLMLTKTEVEALLLERTLIRHHQPRYNVLLRDDKEYPFVRIDFNDDWPRIRKVRRRKDDGAHYIGPFGSAGVLNTLLNTVFRVFPLIRCSPHEFKTVKRPCNYFHMKMCLAPCHKEVDRTAYVSMLKNALRLLEGRNQDLKKTLELKMKAAAQNEDFENAAIYRDQIQAMEKIGIKQSVVSSEFEDADAIGVFRKDDSITFNITLIRDYLVVGHENFRVAAAIDDDEETLISFILQYYHNRLVPKHLLIPIKIKNKADLQTVLSEDRQTQSKIVFPTSKERKDLCELAQQNAKFYTEQQDNLELRRYAELEILKDLFDLPAPPKRIECIDISNMQGSAIVASNVCFINGKPSKDKYRRYNIKTVEGKNDDFASIEEVVGRRLKRGVEEGDLPDLLVIDGGKGQLSSALSAAKDFPQIATTIISIAKSRRQSQAIDLVSTRFSSHERVFMAGRNDPIILREGTPEHRIMTKVRDEAHRFAITFHRKKRQNQSHKSILDDVPGVGPTLKKRLLSTYGDIAGLKSAPFEDVLKIKGMTEKSTTALFSMLNANADETKDKTK
ncbi:MAG: excinuclease ABC subunit UvrC [Pseudobacteriovorax sp.]|nr:excinuclease ABC subunit UvrC [Pseudobacteriovorax sp.]